eukprot:g5744.t1
MAPQQLHAEGFGDHLAALNGTYEQLATPNHGKPQYKKDTKEIEGCTMSCIYFWDARDGESMSGWWVAPVVGGEQVWSFNPSKDALPPPSGWRVPWHEQEANPAIKMSFGGAKRPNDSSTGLATGPNAKVQKTEAGAAVAAVHPSVALRQKKTLDNLEQQVSNIEKAVNKVRDADLHSAEQQRSMNVAQNAFVSTYKFIEAQEKSTFPGEQGAKLNPIKERIQKAEASLKEKQKECEDAMQTKFDNVSAELPEKSREFLQTIEQNVESTKDETVILTCELGEHSSPEDVVAIDDKVKETTEKATAAFKELQTYFVECQTVLRMFPDDKTKEMKEKMDASRKEADTMMKDLNETKRQIERPIKEARLAIEKKRQEREKEERRLEAIRLQEQARLKTQRAAEIGLLSDQLVKKGQQTAAITLKQIHGTQAEVLGLYDLLQTDLEHKDTQSSGALRQTLNKALQRVKKGLGGLHLKEKEVREKSQEEDDKFSVFLSNALNTRMTEDGKTAAAIFEEISGGETALSYKKAQEYFLGSVLAGGSKEHEALLNKYLPSAWRKAVTSLRRAKLSLENKPDPTWNEEQKRTAQEKVLQHEPSEDDDAILGETITANEFALFIAAAHYTCTSECDVTKAKENVVVTGTDDVLGRLDTDDVIRVVNGPESVIYQPPGQAPYEVQRVEVYRVRDGLQGWVNMREPKNSYDNLEKYSNAYEIRQETVLTNTYELKGFKVIRRVKKDEKVLALSVPEFNKDAELLRVKVKAMIDGAEGWITVKGSHGTLFLQSLAVGQASEKGVQTGLNIQKDEESGKSVIVCDGSERKKISGKEWTADLLDEKLFELARQLPGSCHQKLDQIETAREECNAIMDKLSHLDSHTTLEEVSVEKVMADANAATNLQKTNPLMHEKFNEEVSELLTKADSTLREVSQQTGSIRQQLAAYFSDLQNIRLAEDTQKYLRMLKAGADGSLTVDGTLTGAGAATAAASKNTAASKNSDGDVEMKDAEAGAADGGDAAAIVPEIAAPVEEDMQPMTRLKYKLLVIQKRLEGLVEYSKQTSKKKLAFRDELNRKFVAYKKGLEMRELKKTVIDLKDEVEAQEAKLAELDAAKKKVYTQITGETDEDRAAAKKEATAADDKGENKDAEEAASPSSKLVAKSKKPVHSASTLCHLGIEYENELNRFEEHISKLDGWTKEADPGKLLQNKEQWKLVMPNEKIQILQKVIKPYQGLKAKLNEAKRTLKADREFLKDSLEADILLRSRTEIATFFRENDPEAIFKEKLAAKNPENAKEGVAEENKWINCEIVSEFMQAALPEPIPTAILGKIYTVLVGSTKRPMTCDEFCNLFAKMHYRCVKGTIMTEELSLRKFTKKAKLQPGDIVRLIGDVTKTEDMQRFQAETVPSATEANQTPVQGWVTLQGAQGTSFFYLHTPGYEVVKQTVLTDIFEMKEFRPVVRLNVGEQVRAIGFPRKEGKSGLIRVKAVTVGHKSGKEYTGFVTVEGNQNSVYLETCDSLRFPEEQDEAAGLSGRESGALPAAAEAEEKETSASK